MSETAPSAADKASSRTKMPVMKASRRPLAGGFDLLRWYSLVSLVAIAAVAVVFGLIGTRFIVTETLQRDALLTAQFIDSMMATESHHWGFEPTANLAELLDPKVDPTEKGFTGAQVKAARAEFYDHVRLLPDELLANVYAPDQTIIWSSNAALVGRQDTANEDLRDAFTSREMVAKGHLERRHDKKEQEFLIEPRELYIENYIPLKGKDGKVAVVVEVYKEPNDLLEIMARGERLVWFSTAIAAALVYLVTFGIVRRGHRLLMEQQRRLLDNETLVTVGELSTAIAHSLRNSLASIRSSAELVLDGADERTGKKVGDIVAQVDRMSRWIKDLLHYARPLAVREEPVALKAVITDVLADFEAQLHKRRISIETRIADDLPKVWGNHTMLAQALHSVIANAAEAIGEGGRIEVRAVPGKRSGRVTLVVSDNGPGMSKEQLEVAFRPFTTTKQSGLGVGLPMVQQVMERFGGQVELASQPKVGTDVFLHLKVA